MSLMQIVRAPLAAALLALASLATTLPTPALAQASAPAAAAATAPAPAGMATAPVAAKEEVSNPYGLDALWAQGDFVARGTLIIMIIMSMASWYVIFTKLFEQGKLLKSANAVTDSLVKITYHEAMLMMIMMISVPRATKSPCAHSASRP